jgi:PAS domain-containing protein
MRTAPLRLVNRAAQEMGVRAGTPMETWARAGARDAQGHRIPAEEMPLTRALRGETARAVVQHRAPDGSRRALTAAAVPLRRSDGSLRGAVVTFRDETERVHHEVEQQQAAHFRERFIGILGHDLRSPLSAIMAGADDPPPARSSGPPPRRRGPHQLQRGADGADDHRRQSRAAHRSAGRGRRDGVLRSRPRRAASLQPGGERRDLRPRSPARTGATSSWRRARARPCSARTFSGRRPPIRPCGPLHAKACPSGRKRGRRSTSARAPASSCGTST